MSIQTQLDLLNALNLSPDILPYISIGNIKVKCPIFNLPAGTTCRKCLQCATYCYAKKAERLYPTVRPCRMKNYKISKMNSFVDSFTYQYASILEKNTKRFNKDYCRLHEAGDIYSISYLNDLYRIAESFKGVTFYTYTKRTDILTLEDLNRRPKNFIINLSIDGIQTEIPKEIPPGYDNVVVTHETQTNCPALLDKNKKCMRDCFKCAKKGNVIIFHKH